MTFTIKTSFKTELIDITDNIQKIIKASEIIDGICMVFVPHTTAGIIINESADPSVKRDILMVLNQIIPWQADYHHIEGNSPAHIKSSLVGASELIAIESGKSVLGTWQGIFFCEFDGPRTRKVHVKFLGD
ncbi:YjbQ family protein [Candidatus Magnetomoraceae bacterium gMMP-15]